MPNWSQDHLKQYENKTRRPSHSPVVEHPVQDDSLGQVEGEASHAARIAVLVVSFRCRLLDPDNLAPKYFIDGLRYAGLIPNDRQEDIELTVRQVKVEHKTDERTEITLDL
jgi:hypothetical protein